MGYLQQLEVEFKQKKFTKKEAFKKVILTPSESARITFFDTLLLFGPPGYSFVKYYFLETATVMEFVGIFFLFLMIYLLFPLLCYRNTLFMYVFGARQGSRTGMCYLQDDPNTYHAVNKFAWQRARTEEVFLIADDLSGKTSSTLTGMGLCRINNRRFQLFQKYYKEDN